MIVLLWLFACGATFDDSPAGLAAIADAIAADPGATDEILTDNGTDRATFEAALYDLAADPAKSDAYLSARH